MNRLNQLMQQHADSSARSDIECHAEPAEPNKLGPWYIPKSKDPELQETIDLAVEYLTLRGLIARHPEHADWVTVNIAQPIVFPSAQGVAAVIDMGQVIQPDGYAADQKSEDVTNFERMFMAACSDLGAINEALGLDPDDGGAEPILEAIEALKQSLAQPAQEPVAWVNSSNLISAELDRERYKQGACELHTWQAVKGGYHDMPLYANQSTQTTNWAQQPAQAAVPEGIMPENEARLHAIREFLFRVGTRELSRPDAFSAGFEEGTMYGLQCAHQKTIRKGWIPIGDRRPEHDVTVLVYTPGGKYGEVWTDEWTVYREDPIGMGGPTIETGEGWVNHELEEVTHWMPLPAHPVSLNAAPESGEG